MTTSKRPRGRPKEVDSAHAADLAMDQFWRAGIHALSLNALCKLTGLSKPSFYREFGDQDGLIAASLERYRALVVVPLLSLMTQPLPFQELLHDIVQAMTSPGERPPGCLFSTLRVEQETLGPKTKAVVQQIEAERIAAMTAWLKRAQQNQELRGDIPDHLGARFLDSQFTLILLMMGSGHPPDNIRAQAMLALTALVPPAPLQHQTDAAKS